MSLLARLLFLLLALAPLPAAAQPGSWLYAGSDIPPDPAWELGVLPNGLRTAVRRNALPAGSISVRLRIDAGALMERPDERGYAHLLEHMLFRGSRGVPDGEGVRIWQRLGASFGSDSNAYTTLTQTFYALDLPRNDQASLDLALSTLAGMATAATLDPKLVEVERRVVLAERDLRMPPLTRAIDQAGKRVFYAGLAAADAEIAGTEETLAAATPERLRAFYDRWYRPERATLVLVGDVDPAVLRALAERHFGGWRGRGRAPPEPDFGQPAQPPATSATVIHPQASNTMRLIWPQPHDPRPWTVARQSGEYVRQVAARILGRRLTRAARGAAPFTSASAGAGRSRGVMDSAGVSLAHRQGQWRPALNRVFAILAQGVEAPPSRAEIDREIAVLDDALDAQAAARATIRSPQLAGAFNNAVDAGLVVTAPETSRAIFDQVKPGLTPAAVGAAMRALTAGEPRALLTAPVVPEGGERGFAQALAAAREIRAEAQAEARVVRFADLGKPTAPGQVATRSSIPDFGITRVRFANGVELIVKPTDFEKDRVLVSATVGHGLSGLAPERASPTWTAPAIVQGGVGPYDIDDVERLISGRRINFGFGVGERGFEYGGATNARDLPDALRLLATAIAEPRFDAGALSRLKGQAGGTYDSIFAAPGAVFRVFAAEALRSGDKRWTYPAKPQIIGYRAADYRAFWAPLLAAGPRRVVIVGDVDVEAAIAAVAASLGAAVTRPTPPVTPAQVDLRPPAAGTPTLTLHHRGDPAQQLVALVWSTEGALADLPGTRALSVTASIFRTRLFDRFRESEGGSYSPSVGSSQSQVFPRYGVFIVSSQLRGERRADFERAAREIGADLARRGPTEDEVLRATAPIVSGNERNLRTNSFWASALERDLDDPRVLTQIRTTADAYRAVDARAVRRAARKWLRRAPAMTVGVEGPVASPPRSTRVDVN